MQDGKGPILNEKLEFSYGFDATLVEDALLYATDQNKKPAQGRTWLWFFASVLVFGTFSFTLFRALSFGGELRFDAVALIVAASCGALLVALLWGHQAQRAKTKLVSEMGAFAEQTGKTKVTIDHTGLFQENAFSKCWFEWRGVTDIVAAQTGTLLFSGRSVICIPDADLPDGVTPDAFRTQLSAWKTQA